MTAERKRRITTALVASAVLIAMLAFFRRDIGTAYVAWRLRSASDPASELAAAIRMNHWAHSWTFGYSVEAVDAAGAAIQPHKTGNYAAVATVTITWANGSTVRRSVLNRQSLSYIYGE